MREVASNTVPHVPERPGESTGEDGPCRVLILWPHLPGYLAACIKVLLAAYRARVLLIVDRTDAQMNQVALQAQGGFSYASTSETAGSSGADITSRVRDFAPTLVLAGCSRRGVRTQLAEMARSRGALAVWATDHYWRHSWRDYANACASRLGLIHRFYDAAWVPGSPNRDYARRLGFAEDRIFEGVYACDTELFRRVGLNRFTENGSREWPRAFLFIGQYIRRKNLTGLLAAYRTYREKVSEPWELWCAGDGPLKGQIGNVAGVRDLGYQNAPGCAGLMGRAGAFILPSWVDHWGVVIHEAACAGLPILASRTCAATANLVRDGYNGFTFSPQDSAALASLMCRVGSADDARTMGYNSLRTSYQFDPRLWAATLLVDIPRRFGIRSSEPRSRAVKSPGELGQ